MKFEDKSNPYFGGGKITMQEYVDNQQKEMKQEMEKENFETENVYGISEKKIYTLVLAGGGPSLVVEIDTEKNEKYNEIIGGRYIYSWYSTPEIVELSADEAEIVGNYYGLYIE